MKSTSLFLACLSLAGIGLLATSAVRAETVTCESPNGGYKSCPVDTRGGVTLSRQLSSQGCWENDTWGYDRNRIWVNNGCRAQFDVGGSSSSSGNKNAVAAAVVVGLIGAAILANKNKKDREDDRDDNHWGGPRNTFECESVNNRFTYCNNGRVRGQVEVYRQLSRNACNYGQSWGNDNGRVWVDKGCRAEFMVR